MLDHPSIYRLGIGRIIKCMQDSLDYNIDIDEDVMF